MSTRSNNQKTEFVSRLNEAQAYHSMGLFVESLGVYEQILSDISELPPHSQEKVREKIRCLEKEIAEVEKEASRKMSSKDLAYIKKTLAIDEDVSAALDGAKSFKELGLFGEAGSEFEKLFQQGYSAAEIIPELVECYLTMYLPAKVIDEIERMIGHAELSDQEKAASMFLFGVEMEKRDHKNLAVDLYRSAKKNDPEDEEIKAILDSKIAKLSSDSRYEYILNQGMVTRDQLQQALILSETTKKSVEFILLESFEIKKEEIGKALTSFYGCPYRIYDPALPTPAELLRNLNKSFLLHDVWVPLSWGMEGVEILIDNPKDSSKIDRIKALLDTEKIIFSVAIKEDVTAFIKRFFGERKPDESVPDKEIVEGVGLIPDVLSELEELQREERRLPSLPEFVYVEFNLGETLEEERTYRLNVVDYSRHGFGLLITDKDLELRRMLNPGDKIKDITFYATWTLIKVGATVRHITKIEEGQYIMGVESNEIIESSEFI